MSSWRIIFYCLSVKLVFSFLFLDKLPYQSKRAQTALLFFISNKRRDRFMPFPKTWAESIIQTTSLRMSTWLIKSMFYCLSVKPVFSYLLLNRLPYQSKRALTALLFFIVKKRRDRFIPFPKTWVECKIQTVSLRMSTWLINSIFYNNHCAILVSFIYFFSF